jgi:3-deoxy-7-phosphoheptulonate synthase
MEARLFMSEQTIVPLVRRTSLAPAPQREQALVTPRALREMLPVPPSVAELVEQSRAAIRAVLRGTDSRLLVVAGPCSVHDAPSALEYARRLASLRDDHADALLVVMRVYIEKPRTRVGWKGFAMDPDLDGSGRVNDGLHRSRELFLAIAGLGLPIATEIVNPMLAPYLEDVVSWVAIGARTTESPLHRELAARLPCPVGFKNGTDGGVDTAVNAVLAARESQTTIAIDDDGRATLARARGNPDCHVVLRGGARPNYSAPDVAAAIARLEAASLAGRLMVDCGHGNARPAGIGQLTAACDVARQIAGGSRGVVGVMIESNIIGGKQTLAPCRAPTAGQSITDACLDLDETAEALAELAGAVRARRGPA